MIDLFISKILRTALLLLWAVIITSCSAHGELFKRWSKLESKVLSYEVTTGSENEPKATIRGNIVAVERHTKHIEAAIFVNIKIRKPGEKEFQGTVSDFDGNYDLSLEPGSYELSVSHISYKTMKAVPLVLRAGEVHQINIRLVDNGEWQYLD